MINVFSGSFLTSSETMLLILKVCLIEGPSYFLSLIFLKLMVFFGYVVDCIGL